jgi:archaellum component FlaF (FlaF/FlaG flagellin family)
MLSGLKQLPLMSKILFAISLLVLFTWVIPSMFNYFKNVQEQEKRVSELQKVSSKYGIVGKAKAFNKERFIEETKNEISSVTVEAAGEKSYDVVLQVSKEKLDSFTTFLETLSLRYRVEVVSPLSFEEKDKLIEITLSIREL